MHNVVGLFSSKPHFQISIDRLFLTPRLDYEVKKTFFRNQHLKKQNWNHLSLFKEPVFNMQAWVLRHCSCASLPLLCSSAEEKLSTTMEELPITPSQKDIQFPPQ